MRENEQSFSLYVAGERKKMGKHEGAPLFGLNIDLEDFHNKIYEYKDRMSHEAYIDGLNKTFYDLKKRLRTPIYRAMAQEYKVKRKEVYDALGELKYKNGAGEISCWYDVKGVRKKIAPVKRNKKIKRRYRYWPGEFYPGILKGPENPLPTSGRRPHFASTSSGRIVVIHPNETKMYNTKQGCKKKKKITSAVSLAIPQMPLNRGREETEAKIEEVAMKRLVHNMERIINGG